MKRVNLILCIVLIAFTTLLWSCSTIINGSRQDVTVRATPPEAKIYIDGELKGTGRADARLKRGKEHVVEVRLDGYRVGRVTTSKEIEPWFFANILCGGIIGGVVDLITGAAFQVDPDNIFITLESGTGSIEVPTQGNFGTLNVRSAAGEQLATLSVTWE